jgi:hypothetical protein
LKLQRLIVLLPILAISAGAFAQLSADIPDKIRTGIQDYSNLNIFSGTSYNGTISHSGSDPATYLNSMSISTGAGWDDRIALSVPTGTVDTNEGAYTLGTAIEGDKYWYAYNLVTAGQIDGGVLPGVYDFSLNLFGGVEASSNDLLSSVSLQLEVFNRLDVVASAVANPDTIGIGQQTTVSMTVTNQMQNRDFRTTTWFTAGGTGDPGFGALQFDGFYGNWFDQVIAPGASHTDEHTKWTATGSTPTGAYQSWLGVVGGLHPSDWFWIRASNATVNVVPEPATMTILLGGLALVARRRRK